MLVIQDSWMLSIAQRFSENNAWAIDSTFKTNQFDFPLFGAVLPNQLGHAMPIWFMVCSDNKGKGHQTIALRLTFWVVFNRLGCLRPRALVIDKSIVELQAIADVVATDDACWSMDGRGTHEGGMRHSFMHVSCQEGMGGDFVTKGSTRR